MARIRIIDEWLRSPVTPPMRHRVVMVVAEKWAEQRALMRAFSASADQTRPTIVLHGVELAIGPAGTDPNAEWGIHVEPPVDGQAQELRGQLELAARRLSGSKGNPPRLEDESPRFDGKATHMWAPGTPPDPPPSGARFGRGVGYYEPALAARAAQAQSTHIAEATAGASAAGPDAVTQPALETAAMRPSVGGGSTQPAIASIFGARRVRRGSPTDRYPVAGAPNPGYRGPVGAPVSTGPSPSTPTRVRSVGSRTQPGFVPPDRTDPSTAAVAPTLVSRPPLRSVAAPTPAAAAARAPLSFASLVRRTMPLGLQLSQTERDLLNALGRAPRLTAREVARIVDAGDNGDNGDNGGSRDNGDPRDAVAFMAQFLDKLASLGLDLVAVGEPADGEPTYLLRR